MFQEQDQEKKMANQALEYVPFETKGNKTLHTGRWAYGVKYNPDGSVKEFRARWVMRGFTMQYAKDYDDSYLGGVNTSTWHSVFGKASKLKRPVHSADNTAAFTTATMDREMYIECPHGYEQKGKICLMKKKYPEILNVLVQRK